jgi:hypothetical protein
MRRRKWLTALVVTIVAPLAGAAFAPWPAPITPGLTRRNFDRVAQVMTRPEVEAQLGKPTFFVCVLSMGLPVTHPHSGIAHWCTGEIRTRMAEPSVE